MQSVALHTICDRETEIEAFVPKEYWSPEVITHVADDKKPLKARYCGVGKEKTRLRNEVKCFSAIKDCEGRPFLVQEIKKSERNRKASLPFTTPTSQQEASKRLNFSTQKTMRIVQQLYESVEVGGRGTIVPITYLRTGSTRIAEEADAVAQMYIRENHGEMCVTAKRKGKQGGQKIQGAHEVIRPIGITLIPATVKASLLRDQFHPCQLIWKHFVAGHMQEAVYTSTSARLVCNKHRFSLSGSSLKFSGPMEVYNDSEEEGEEKPDAALSKLNEGEGFVLGGFDRERHFTQPSAHYIETSLAYAMEEQGIGRPSTYVPTITTILVRRYATKEQKDSYVTGLDQVVNRMMVESFPVIVEPQSTANLERLLDSVGEDKMDWKIIVENFHPDLNAAVKQAEEELESVKIIDKESDVDYELCGRHMVIKYGPHGKFPACPGFSECRNTKSYPKEIGVRCPRCDGELIRKRTKKGRIYYGYENNPACEFMSWVEPSGKRCPKCGGYMIERGNKLVCADEACGYDEVFGREDRD